MKPRRWPILVAGVILLAGACSSNSPGPTASSAPPPAGTSAPPASSAPPSSSPPSAAPSSPTAPPSSADGAEVTEGVFAWTMPCAKPRQQDITGDDLDELGVTKTRVYACGKLGEAGVSGALIATLKAEPSEADAQQLAQTAVSEVAGGKAKLTRADHNGHPGWSTQVERSGKKIGFQIVWSGTAMGLFFTSPPDNLPALLGTLQVKG